ncbi:MAG TPA: prolyl oligopeptidase family serine peptidase, partial [Anaerolineaceae bacterium]|jgi:dipeptidyl-peptidase-4|nr:prolyl oligopeptidase family serine peptidase [Anaerolineaceae bacterium]
MGTPESNPSGYISSSVLNDVENITGKLLIIHGLIDENVHFRHSTRLIQAFISSGKPYQFLILPNARHSVRSQSDREYMEEKIGEFFLENL